MGWGPHLSVLACLNTTLKREPATHPITYSHSVAAGSQSDSLAVGWNRSVAAAVSVTVAVAVAIAVTAAITVAGRCSLVTPQHLGFDAYTTTRAMSALRMCRRAALGRARHCLCILWGGKIGLNEQGCTSDMPIPYVLHQQSAPAS